MSINADQPVPEDPNGFHPSLNALPKNPQDVTEQNALNSQVTKAVWFTRPTPLFADTSTLSGIEKIKAMGTGQPLLNTWYDKADVQSSWTRLPMTDQALFEATAKSISSRSTGKGLFSEMIDQSAYQSTIGVRVTPQELMYQLAYQRGVLNDDGSFKPKKAAKDQYGTQTAVSKQVDLTDPDTARGVLDNALETYLGRKSGPQDQAAFLAALQQHERANPEISRTTQVTSPGQTSGGNTTQTSLTKGGSDATQYAEDYARGQEGAAEFQAASTYLDEFMKALKNPNDVV
jgi:hypothetical protein